jgi:hypothetical protein
MGKKSPPPKPPDLSPISDAQLQIARESNELAREFMGMSKDQFKYFQENAQEELALARQQADRLFEFQNKAFESDEEAKEFARQVGQTQIDSMNLQMDYAQRDRERYESVFLPMQDQYIKEAQEYDTAARREEAAGAAMADTQRQAEAARANADQRLRSMGLDPSQMRSASLLQTQDVMGAAQQAAAANQERLRVENQGRAMRADAMNLGMGLPAQAAAGFGGAGAAGAGAVGAGQAGQQAQLAAIQGGAGVGGQAMGFRSGALNQLSNLTGSPMQWAGMGNQMYGTSMGGLSSAGNTINQGYQNQSQQWQQGQQQSQQMISNVMGAAGMMAMAAEGGEIRRNHYAEGGDVNGYRYYADGDFVDPRRGGQAPPSPVSRPDVMMPPTDGNGGGITQPYPQQPGMPVGGGRGFQSGAPGGGTVVPTQFDRPGSGGPMDPIALGMRQPGGAVQGPRPPRGMMPPPGGGVVPPNMQPGRGGPPRGMEPTPMQRPPRMGQPPGDMAGGRRPLPQMQGGGGKMRPPPGGGVMPPRGGQQPMPGTQPTMPYNPQAAAMVAEGGYLYGAEGLGGLIGKVAKEKIPMENFKVDVGDVKQTIMKPNAEFQRDPTLQERLQKGLMVASMAPENSWAGGQTGAGQYSDAMSQLRNKDYINQGLGGSTGNFAEGGSPMRARGAVPSRQSRDEIPAYLAEGEYVLPADVVRALGIEKLDAKYHRENA